MLDLLHIDELEVINKQYMMGLDSAVTFVTLMVLLRQESSILKFKVNLEPLSAMKCVFLSGKCTPEMIHEKHDYRDDVAGQRDCSGIIIQSNEVKHPFSKQKPETPTTATTA